MLMSPALRWAAAPMMIVHSKKSVTICQETGKEKNASLFVLPVHAPKGQLAQLLTIKKFVNAIHLYKVMDMLLAMKVSILINLETISS